MIVLPIKNEETYPWLLQKHYAKRIPQIMFAFGLYENNQLIGVCTYGIPASPSLCMGICGKDWSSKVLELNRLCLQNKSIQKNNTSGFKGVYKHQNRWRVRLMINNKSKSFGLYNDIDYAKFVAEAMRYKYHKEFARTN